MGEACKTDEFHAQGRHVVRARCDGALVLCGRELGGVVAEEWRDMQCIDVLYRCILLLITVFVLQGWASESATDGHDSASGNTYIHAHPVQAFAWAAT